MKKAVAVILTVLILISLVSCRNENAPEFSSDALFSRLKEDILAKKDSSEITFSGSVSLNEAEFFTEKFFGESFCFSQLLNGVDISVSGGFFSTQLCFSYSYNDGNFEKYTENGSILSYNYSKELFGEVLFDMAAGKKQNGYFVVDAKSTDADTVLSDQHGAFCSRPENMYFLSSIQTQVTTYSDHLLIEITAEPQSDLADSIFYMTEKNIDTVMHFIDECSTWTETVAVFAERQRAEEIEEAYLIAYENDCADAVVTPETYFLREFAISENMAVFDIVPQNAYNEKEITDIQNMLDKKVSDIVKSINAQGGTDGQKAKAALESVCREASYNDGLAMQAADEAARTKEFFKGRTAAGALLDKSTICTGYCAALKAILDRLGIQSWSLGGKVYSGEAHEWLAVSIDGKTKYIDPTFADADTGGEYFLFTEEYFSRDQRSIEEYWVMPF